MEEEACTINDRMFTASFKIICSLFSLKKLKPYQEECLKTLVEQEDCFLCQPTGSGKSIVFQSLPYFKYALDLYGTDLLNADTEPSKQDVVVLKDTCPYKVLVVSPLTSLMKDQEKQLQKKELKVCCLTQNDGNDEANQDLATIKGQYNALELFFFYFISSFATLLLFTQFCFSLDSA